MQDFLTWNSNALISEITDDMKTKIKREFYDLYLTDQVLINRSDLILKECIGRGNYGLVYRAILKLEENEVEEVAVKVLENRKFV